MTEKITANSQNSTQPADQRQSATRRTRTIRTSYLIGALFLMISIVLDMLNYGEFGAWQILAEAAGDFLSLIVLVISFVNFSRGNKARADFLIPISIMLTYTTGDLFVEGGVLYNLLSGLILFGIAFYLFRPKNGVHWLRAAFIHIVAVLLLSNLNLFPRFSLSQVGTQVAITFTLTILLLWQLISNFQIRTIQARLLIILIALGLGPVLVASTASVIIDLRRDTTLAENNIEAVTELKKEQIRNWALDLESDMKTLESNPVFVTNVEFLTRFTPTESFRQQTSEEIRQELNNLLLASQRYDSLSVVNPDGIILVSTDSQLEGVSLTSNLDFSYGVNDIYFATPKIDPETRQPRADLYYPLETSQGRTLLGVLYANIDMNFLTSAVQEAALQLGESGEAYLLSSQDQLLTPLRTNTEISIGSYSIGSEAFAAIGRDIRSYETETLQYENFAGERVIGSYTWIPEIKSSLVVEQSQFEAFQSLRLNLLLNGLIAVIALAVTATIATSTAQNFATPIKNLSDAARRVWQGEIAKIDPIERADEIGELSTTLSEMTARLSETTVNLEQTVAERTAVLERRAKYLETVSAISRAVTSIYDINALLNTITQLISENFGFYHVGIFLNDERDEYAVLRAANSEGGWKMLAREHKLKVGEQGIVGFVTGTGQPRIQQQVVGEDSVYFTNPDLPQTRSEMALPLKVGANVFGALDVQSTEERAFSEEDVTVLQGLADSLAVAIQNTRLIQQLQENLEAERRLFGEITRETWHAMLARSNRGFSIRSDQGGTDIVTSPSTEIGQRALHEKATIIGGLDEDARAYPLAIPVTVRGGVAIGVVETQKPAAEGPWTQEEISILENVSSELGLALDNARLFEETQRKAQRDRIAAELSTKIWSSSDVENILQTAVRELGSALQVSQGTIRLSLPEEGQFEKSADGANQS